MSLKACSFPSSSHLTLSLALPPEMKQTSYFAMAVVAAAPEEVEQLLREGRTGFSVRRPAYLLILAAFAGFVLAAVSDKAYAIVALAITTGMVTDNKEGESVLENLVVHMHSVVAL